MFPPVLDGIAHHRCNNRNSGGCLPGGKGGRRIRREDEVNLETNQLRCEIWEPLDPRVRASVLDGDVSTLRIAELTQPLPEGVELHSRLGGFQRTGYHQTNPWDFRRWLGIHAQRQGGCRAAEQREEVASFHCPILPCFRQDAPCTRAIERFGDIVAHAILGGLHHRYARI